MCGGISFIAAPRPRPSVAALCAGGRRRRLDGLRHHLRPRGHAPLPVGARRRAPHAVVGVHPLTSGPHRSMCWCELPTEVSVVPPLHLGEVEQQRQVPPIRKLGLRIPEVVEERVGAGRQRRRAPRGVVGEHRAHEVDGLRGRTRSEHLRPRMRLDLRELELAVVRVHGLDLLLARRPEHLDDLHELVHARLTREDGLAQEQFARDAALGPHVDSRRVVGRPEY
mmetsp:Transcript_13782/g.40813  ORF Transcript_13782/g.40813 Transcript_13782/m.40813 type:complete len:224 (+) Transcript_13782:903-1574(+)